MSKFIPSVYQQKIYDFISNGSGNAVVSAVAGSGKTTTLLNAINLFPKNIQVLFLAFNKSIKEEIEEKIKVNNVDVKTVHGYGFSSLQKSFKFDIDNNKYRNLLKDIVMYSSGGDFTVLKKYNFENHIYKLVNDFMLTPEENETIEDKVGYFNRVVKLCDLGRLNLVDLKNLDNGVEQLRDLAIKHNVEIINGECYRAWLLISLGASYTHKADFTDMVFLPLVYNLNCQQYDVTFIDECQDLNSCQRELMKKSLKQDGRFVAVGDPAQAIYGFAGADSESFQKLQSIPNTITLPLSVSYRCGKKIIELAKSIMPQIEHCDTARDGIVDTNASWKNIKSDDMVVCRNVAPLVCLCMKMLQENKKAYIMGTDISKNLINLVESCRKKREEFILENIFRRIYAEKKKLVDSIARKEKITVEDAENSQTVQTLQDKINCLEVLSEGLENGDELILKLKEIFSDNSTGICLSSIHKSKGLEADKVFIIHPELMPSKYAKKDWEKEQEKNLEYVAITRAKSYLGYVKDFDAYKNITSSDKGEEVNDKVSNFVGEIGHKTKVTLTVLEVKEMNTSFGDTTLYEMIDEKGNIFTKFGKINERFLVSNNHEIAVGSILEFNATIKAHKEFKGIKTNVISTVSK